MDEVYEFLAAVVVAIAVYVFLGYIVEWSSVGTFNPELLRVVISLMVPLGAKGLLES